LPISQFLDEARELGSGLVHPNGLTHRFRLSHAVWKVAHGWAPTRIPVTAGPARSTLYMSVGGSKATISFFSR
jgi:hypothetical protein